MSGPTILPSAPMEAMTAAALDALRPVTRRLRESGWDAGLMIRQPSTGERTVSIDITLSVRVPVESIVTRDGA